jgi:hypothetical protein
MPSKILTVGFEIPGGEVEYLPLSSNRSLLDADIILFEPSIPEDYHEYKDYKGLPLLDDTGSFAVTRESAHWKAELRAAFDEGKTILIFLACPEEAYIYTGDKTYSGTGRNRQTTNIVTSYSSYQAIPFQFTSVVPKSGEIIAPAVDLQYLAGYWKEFGAFSRYEVHVEGKFSQVFLSTKAGNRVVGAAVSGKGLMLMLPPLRYDEESFTAYDKNDREVWTDEAKTFGKRLVAALVALDKAARSGREVTPVPEWAQDAQFRLKSETETEHRIAATVSQIETLQAEKAALLAHLEVERGLRLLLYAQGKELEAAILEALGLMGFSAETYTDGESEFDAVFTSPEGRFLGEAEGKDTRSINIDKLSQLERNLQEDFARDEVTEYAKGVLFGNAYRLTALTERGAFFTEKCISGAERLKLALVRTPDLFPVAKYLRENTDADYARRCREAIAGAEGVVVQFPSIPNAEPEAEQIISDGTVSDAPDADNSAPT